jgi:hypothetical protein
MPHILATQLVELCQLLDKTLSRNIIVICGKNFSHHILFLKCYKWNNKVMQLAQHERVTTTMALGEGVMILASS